ncbi:MAG: nickel insertion protein, partial [Nitrospinota bacterium]
MKGAYFDCPAGASGDMIIGALLDAGATVVVDGQSVTTGPDG